MNCKYCDHPCQKAGRQKNGVQKLYCRGCYKYQQSEYKSKACIKGVKALIPRLLCESVSVRGMARILGISINTVQEFIVLAARQINKPAIPLQQDNVELDELHTYIGHKENQYWIAYALNRATGKVLDFVIGKRSKRTLRMLVNTILLSRPGVMSTDRLNIYQTLIPPAIHECKRYCTNRIERKNLSLRTDIKRLSRRTICFSRSLRMLESCLQIYFWGCHQ